MYATAFDGFSNTLDHILTSYTSFTSWKSTKLHKMHSIGWDSRNHRLDLLSLYRKFNLVEGISQSVALDVWRSLWGCCEVCVNLKSECETMWWTSEWCSATLFITLGNCLCQLEGDAYKGSTAREPSSSQDGVILVEHSWCLLCATVIVECLWHKVFSCYWRRGVHGRRHFIKERTKWAAGKCALHQPDNDVWDLRRYEQKYAM